LKLKEINGNLCKTIENREKSMRINENQSKLSPMKSNKKFMKSMKTKGKSIDVNDNQCIIRHSFR